MNCPRCGAILEFLSTIMESKIGYRNYGVFRRDISKGTYHNFVIPTTLPGKVTSYQCPGCYVELTKNKKQAVAILSDRMTSKIAQRFAEIAFTPREVERVVEMNRVW